MPSSELAVEVQDLRHRYGEREALKGVSFAVGRGEIFGLLGPNGGGKTTLFRILSTLMIPTSGRAALLGSVLDQAPSQETLQTIRKAIGVVFQAFSLDKKLTVRENLTCQGNLYGLSGNSLRGRIDEMLERFRLSDRARDLVGTLSGGLSRRVELAKGLLHRPALLLMDEPATGLDPGARHDLWEYLQSLRKQDSVTVLMTTHILEEAERCDRIALLHAGRLVALGTVGDLKEVFAGRAVLEVAAPRFLEAHQRIEEQSWALETSLFGDRLHVVVEDPEDGKRRILALLEEDGNTPASVERIVPSLEDVFIHSIESADAAAQGGQP